MRNKIVIAVVVVVALVAGAGFYLLSRDDAPDEVSLDAAVEAAQGGATTTVSGGADTTVGAESGLTGTWVLDAESGTFDYEQATGSFVGFRIDEEIINMGGMTAVGRTGEVEGSITIEGTTLTAVDITVDMASITTNESRRDDKVLDALEVTAFPTATFTLSEPVELGSDAATGADVKVSAAGELTIHGVTKAVSLPIEAKLVDGTAVVVASVDVALADYGVSKPTAPLIASISDTATVEMQLLFTTP